MAWQAAYGISSRSLSRVWKQVKSGVLQIERKISSSRSRKTDIAVAWMAHFFNCVGDIMPDGVEINLPSYLNYKLMYGYMCKDLANNGDEVISYTQFTCVMKGDFPEVRIPKVQYCIQLGFVCHTHCPSKSLACIAK